MQLIRQILQRLQHNKSADITRKDLLSLKNSVLQNNSRPLESIKSSGRVAFFVLKKVENGYSIRIGQKSFTLLTKENLLKSRMYIGLITENSGSTIRMTSNFEQIELSSRISQFYKEFPIRIIQLVLRSGMPLRRETLAAVKKLLGRFAEQGIEDIILDLWQKRLPPELLIKELGQNFDDGDSKQREQNSGKPGNKSQNDRLKEQIKRMVNRSSGRESALLLYNHVMHDSRSHWVHIPLNLTHPSCKIEGYLRLCIDVTTKRMLKAVIHTKGNGEKECVCEIIPDKSKYLLKGNFPPKIADKIVGISPKIVDILETDRADFTGLGFTEADNLLKGIDLDA